MRRVVVKSENPNNRLIVAHNAIHYPGLNSSHHDGILALICICTSRPLPQAHTDFDLPLCVCAQVSGSRCRRRLPCRGDLPDARSAGAYAATAGVRGGPACGDLVKQVR